MRLGFGLVAAGIAYAVIEAGSYALLGLVDDESFSFDAMQERRNSVHGAVSDAAAKGQTDDPPRHVQNKFVHPYVGFVQDPNGRRPQVPRKRHLPVNRFGYIDSDDPIHERADDRFILGIVGGSVARDFSWIGVEFLEEELAAAPYFADREIVFVRLGLSGYKQPQQLMTISYLLSLGAEFDAVVNIDGFNEVALHLAENAQTGTFAAFPRHWYYQIVDLPQSLSDEYQYLRVRRRRLAELFSRPGLRHSVTSNLIWLMRDRQLSHDVYAAHESMMEAAPKRANAAATGPAREYPDENAAVEHLVEIWKESSIQLDRLLRANATAYIHVLHPNQYYPGTKPMGDKERRSALKEDYKYRRGAELGFSLLVSGGRQLASQGVRFLDLTMAFAEHSDPLYVDACCHFNKWGHQIVARSIAHELLAQFDSPHPDSQAGRSGIEFGR